MKRSAGIIIFILLVVACGTKEKSESKIKESESQQWETGVALYSFNRFPFSESLDKAKVAEIKYVEGFSFHKLGDEFDNRKLLELSDSQIKKMSKMIEDRGLQMRSLYAGAKTESEWERFFKIGQKLELDFLVGEPERKQWDFLDSLAGEYGIRLAIHQHAKGSSRYWHPDSVLTALEGRENFGACADLGHWVRSGLDPVKSLKKLEGHIISLHAKDVDEFGNVKANDVKVGSGVIDYKAVVEELDRQEFSGLVYVECEHDWENNVDDVLYAIEYLNRLKEEVAAKSQ